MEWSDPQMRQDPKISWTATEDGPKEIIVVLIRLATYGPHNFLDLATGVDDLASLNMVTEQTVGAAVLSITTGLAMSPHMHMGALSMRHEHVLLPESRVEL